MFKTRKNLKIQMENNKLLNEQMIKLRRENIEYQKQIQRLLSTNQEIGLENTKIDILKKEVKRLKTLLTKNKINYEKENK